MNKIFLGVVAGAVVAGAFWFGYSRDEDKNVSENTVFPSGQTREVAVSMIHDGFSPKNITIKRGDTVTFVNEDSQSHWPASNIHPTHSIYPEFDPKRSLKQGESWSFVFEKEGIWRYHDHVAPSLAGTVVVE